MKRIFKLLPFLDDILAMLGLAAMVTASYLVNAVLGTYVLGIAFFVSAAFAGIALKSPAVQEVLSKFSKRK